MITQLFRTFRIIGAHPLNTGARLSALGRYLRWQLGSRLLPGAVAVNYIAGTRLLVAHGMTGATGNIYCGLHEFEEMAFVLHLLRPDDLFVDVGANIGSYSILAAGAARARVLALEPVPKVFESLLDNVHLNRLEPQIRALNLAAGATAGSLAFTTNLDTMNHALPASAQTVGAQSIQVPVQTLDQIVAGEQPKMLKIDVEGYETAVLSGAKSVLSNPSLSALIVELNGSGARYGYDDESLHQEILSLGFEPVHYEPFTRALTVLPGRNHAGGNTIYVRNPQTTTLTLAAAPRYRVLNTEL